MENHAMPFASFEYQLLPSPEEMSALLPLLPHQREAICVARERVRRILRGESQERLFIVGPCSIHHIDEAKTYAEQLCKLQEEVKGALCIVMRAYFEKPRTLLGWKGMLYDPTLTGLCDIREGLIQARQFLLFLADLGLPAATEFLDPMTSYYLGEMIAWGCIGARTVASPIHRQLASFLECPVGCKNGLDGQLDTAFDAIICARTPQAFWGMSPTGQIAQVHSRGNPDAHLVLRGGRERPNCDALSIRQALDQAALLGIDAPLLVDCAHDNSRKDYVCQPGIALDVVEQICGGAEGIKGIMIESNLQPGRQPLFIDASERKYGVSVTDGCLGWEATQHLAIQTHKRLTTFACEEKRH